MVLPVFTYISRNLDSSFSASQSKSLGRMAELMYSGQLATPAPSATPQKPEPVEMRDFRRILAACAGRNLAGGGRETKTTPGGADPIDC